MNRLPAPLLIVITIFMSVSASVRAAQPVEFPLWPDGIPGALPPEKITDKDTAIPTLTPYILNDASATHPVVVVCPGGGYSHLAMEKEGFTVARWLNSLGISALVLKYRLKDYGHPAPLRDVLQAVRTVRSRAGEWHVDPSTVGVLGFSAGGHLASCAGTLYDAPEGKTGSSLDNISARPDFLVLVYPVITMKDPFVHKGSRLSLLGASPSAELISELSTETQITKNTPPTFLVHSSADTTVPSENSVEFYQALRRVSVPAEMHLYETGPHGFGINPGFGPTSGWPKRCEEWMRARKIIPQQAS